MTSQCDLANVYVTPHLILWLNSTKKQQISLSFDTNAFWLHAIAWLTNKIAKSPAWGLFWLMPTQSKWQNVTHN